MIKTYARYAAYAFVLLAALLLVGCEPGANQTDRAAQQPVKEEVRPAIPPRPDGLIGDTASVLSSSDIESLQRHAEQAGREANMQIGVAVVGSLGGRSIEKVALYTARDWGVGHKEAASRGVLIMIAPNERKTRLEVSKHFEGVLTDGRAGAVLDLAKTEFRGRQWAAGLHKIIDGVKQKGSQQLTMNSNPFSGTMLGFAAPFFALGLGSGLLLLLLAVGLLYLAYRVFFKSTDEDEDDEIFNDPRAKELLPESYVPDTFGGSPYAPYRNVDGGASRRVNSTPIRTPESRVREDDDSDLTSAALVAAAASAYEPSSEPVELPSAGSSFEPTPVREQFGGGGLFGGGGATRSIEVDDAPSGLFESSTPLPSSTRDDSPSESSGVSSSFDYSSNDSGGNDSSSSDSSGGSSDF